MQLLRNGLVVVALAAALPVAAQDAEQIGLAREMFVAMRASDNFDAILPSMMQAMKPALTAGNPKAAKDFDEILPLISQEFVAMKGGMIDEMATIYAKSFEKGELRQFVAFYKTPAGEKLTRLTPTLGQQMMVVGQKFGQQVAVKVAERMKEELRKRGNKI